MKHPLIIGAGGVASYLLPVLLKSFKPEKLTIVDKDILEERNLDRQMFHHTFVGRNKADALIAIHANLFDDSPNKCCTVIEDWFNADTQIPDDIDCIICCADNHMARHEAIKLARKLHIFAFIGGNEYLDSQAFVYHPLWADTDRDILKRYPNIQFDEEGSPTACTGLAQQGSPQLAVANLNCAAKLLHLMWVYERWLPEAVNTSSPDTNREALIKLLPTEFFTSLTENSATV